MPRSAAPSFSLLARLRRFYGLSQTELAALLGLSGAQLSRLEAGQQAISPAVATRLAPFLAPLEAPAEAARAGLTPPQKTAAQRALIAATARKANLELSSAAVTGPTAYLADVDADHVDAQLATLEAAIQAVTARKAALPS
jgi:transcriptional regulator with XRE-family HTH domain